MAGAVITSHNSVHTLDRFDPALRMPAAGSQVLAGIKSYQQLYIFAHGYTGNNRVYNGTGEPMTVEALASQLKQQGLPLGIKKIKLWVCNAGTQDAAGESTAKYFKQAMVKEMYANVKVFGYSLCLGVGLNAGKHKVGIKEAAVQRVAAAKQEAMERAASPRREALSDEDLDRMMDGGPLPTAASTPIDTGAGRFQESEKVSAKKIRHQF